MQDLEAGIHTPSREGPKAETKHKSRQRAREVKLSAKMSQAGSFASEDCFGRGE